MAQMLVLSLTPEVLDAVEKVIAFAHEHPRTMESPLNSPQNSLRLWGTTVFYSIDKEGDRSYKHMSVSMENRRAVPRILMLELVRLFKFNDPDLGILPSDPAWVVHAIEPHKGEPEQ